jgi:hypothetical protein
MQLGAYEILEELTPGKSFRARDLFGREVVLKILPPDCLLEGALNPNIADRLRRVREIAMTDIANLRGVERDGNRAFLVWDFVPGVRIDEFAGDTTNLVRDLKQTVEHFHSTGLVHGALHAGNVLVDVSGRIWLIDVSPLLFLDPKRDEHAIESLCATMTREQHALVDLPKLAPRVRVRRRTLLAAMGVILFGAGVAITIHRVVSRNQPALPTPPKLAK